MACQIDTGCLIKYFLVRKFIAGVLDLYNEVIFTTTCFKVLYKVLKMLSILHTVIL